MKPFGIKVAPVVPIDLPSNGYVEGVPAKVYMSPITGAQELKMNTLPNLSSYIDYVIASCVSTDDSKHEALDVDKLTSQDKIRLLFGLRSITYSDQYTSQVACTNPECGHVFKASTRISSLGVKYLQADPADELSNLELPDSGIKISLQLSSESAVAKMETELKILQAKYKATPAEELREVLRIILNIKSWTYMSTDGEGVEIPVNVDPSTGGGRSDTKTLIENLSGRDLAFISSRIRDANDFGSDLVALVPCESCGGIAPLQISIDSTEFFRPSDS